eukprot:TRINITY_DN23157_c0_g1_i1.p1 TRINITY_DN23157_c0_g1~~TRINITY_DN23157_c0_g1_i1.p1  ORF type:complete len:408 (-),score=142.11 TRINITY_DN23157_c0_g1_i1:268-1491(-)
MSSKDSHPPEKKLKTSSHPLPSSLKAIPTPAFLVDIDALKNNCDVMLAKAKQLGVKMRPHMKTHKTLEAGHYQVHGSSGGFEGVVVGVEVSTLGEAEFYVNGSADYKFDDVFYATPISPNKFEKVYALTRKIKRFSIMLDHPTSVDAAESFANAKRAAGHTDFAWSVFLKIDCGYHRAGVDPEADSTMALAKRLHDSPAFDFQGVYSHSGHTYVHRNPEDIRKVADEERHVMAKFVDAASKHGIAIRHVSVGATPSCSTSLTFDGVTEIHPGNYVFFDRFQATVGSCTMDDVAGSVLTTVISHYPDRGRFLIDAGALALSKDIGATDGRDFGHIVGHPHLRIVAITQEVGTVESDGSRPIDFSMYPIDSQLRILPNHSCLTAACFPRFYVTSGDKIVDIWETAPREW